jgi:hypothetical protein
MTTSPRPLPPWLYGNFHLAFLLFFAMTAPVDNRL